MNQKLMMFTISRLLLKPRIPVQNHIPVRNINKMTRITLLSLHARKNEEEMRYQRPETPRFAFVDWNYDAEIYAFGKRLGENFNDHILRQAFANKSYVVEQLKKQEELGLQAIQIKDNEYLSSEGRNLLYKTLTSSIQQEFPKFPAVGVESVVNHLMSEPVLSNISSLLGTKDLILSNEYPPTETTYAQTFLAIIAAVEKSSGISSAEKFIKHFVLTYLYDKELTDFWDIEKPWAMLTDIMNQKGETFEPRLLRESGKNTILAVFVVGIYDSKKQLIGQGIGETVDIAQEMAARDTLKGIFDTRDPVHNLRLD